MEPQQFDAHNIEILKAARRQVIPDKIEEPPTETNPVSMNDALLARDIQKIPEVSRSAPYYNEKGVVEELFRKLHVLVEEEQAIKKEKEQFDKIWASLEEKRQRLDTRLAAINRVKGKLMALNKEVEEIIKVSA